MRTEATFSPTYPNRGGILSPPNTSAHTAGATLPSLVHLLALLLLVSLLLLLALSLLLLLLLLACRCC